MKIETIIVIGGANIEYIIKSKTDIVQGSKNFVEVEELYGGGGLNYALRLMSVGKRVYPLLYVGNDSIGTNIQRFLLEHCRNDHQTCEFIKRDSFFIGDLKTIRSIIIVEGQNRTILAQDQNSHNLFFNFLQKEVKSLVDISTVVIGHIHNDRADINDDNLNLSTIFAIDYFSKSKKFIYCNFGATQIEYGYLFWEDYLRSIDILQLNIYEIRLFFRSTHSSPTLLEMIESFISLGISGIITLDKFGAIGFKKGMKKTIFMARPALLGDDFVDSTGAGDAFCAGMISVLGGNRNFSADTFKKAMEIARSWAVFACKSYGGANNCPSKNTIDSFHKMTNKGNEVVTYRDDKMVDVISLIDSTFK